MASFETAYKYGELLDLYGPLLSETQREMLEDYFGYNLSISEIADNRHVSRAAVEDAIKKGKKKLDTLEKQLGNYKVLEKVYEIKSKTSDNEVISSLEEIERIMKHGI